MADTKPLVVFGCTPIYGHLLPVRKIVKGLIQLGYEVTFVSCSHYQKLFEEIGCNYVAIEGYGDWYEGDLKTRFAERDTLPHGPVQLAYDIENCFLKVIPSQHAAMQKAIKLNMERHPGRPIVQLSEGVFQGSLPVTLGAGVKPTATMGIGVIPMSLASRDTAPFGPGLPPPTSDEQRAQYAAMGKQVAGFFTKCEQIYSEMFEEVGAKAPPMFMFDALYYLQDRFIQMAPPSSEYPRSDAPDTIRFSGGIPKGARPDFDPPSFWKEITTDRGNKDIILVCQGTIALQYNDLIIPTMNALKDRPNTIVVAALGVRGQTLPEGTVVPDNARVADYISFDEILPYCSIFVTNGGYGAFQHSISNGVPVICGGTTEDKPEVCARVEWSGMGINLKTAQPTEEQLLEAVDEIIKNKKYLTRAKEMEAEMASFDPITVVAKNIDELAAEKAAK